MPLLHHIHTHVILHLKVPRKFRERFFGPLFFKQKKEDPNSEKMIDDNHLYCSECVKLSTHNTIEDHKVS